MPERSFPNGFGNSNIFTCSSAPGEARLTNNCLKSSQDVLLRLVNHSDPSFVSAWQRTVGTSLLARCCSHCAVKYPISANRFIRAKVSDEEQSRETGFKWPEYPPLEYAIPLAKQSVTRTYAPPYSELSTLLAHQSTTVWSSDAHPTDSVDPYGNVAWTSLWANYSSITSPPFTTTALATPIPKSELVKPTPLPFSFNVEGSGKEPRFPTNFLWGVDSAALQVEGAIKEEGRGPSITEFIMMAREGMIKGGGPPDIANLNYYLYRKDIARLAAVGVKSYSFSISWSRILPFGRPGSPVNKQAIEHYDDLINTLIEYGMTPVVTLNHFDTPLYYLTSTSWQ
jgi:hypothetical protein